MNLTWHIVLKDWRRMRARIIAWLALLAAKTALGFLLIAGDGPGWLGANGTEILIVLTALDAGLCFLMAVGLVLEDSPVEERAFWRTRPTSGARLLGAKLLGAALLFGALPVLAWLPWWLRCGYGLREIMWAAGETFFWQAALVTPAMLLAALAGTLGRVLLWSMVLMMALMVSMLYAGPRIAEAGPGVELSRATLMIGLALTAAAGAVVAQYLMRRRWRSLGLFVAGSMVALFGGGYWPWNLFAWAEKQDLDGEVAKRIAAVALDFAGARTTATRKEMIKAGRQDLGVSLRLRGVPAELVVVGGRVTQSWQWGEAASFNSGGWIWFSGDPTRRILGLRPPTPDAETEAHYEAIHVKRNQPPLVRHDRDDEVTGRVSGTLPRSVVARYGQTEATYSARAELLLLRPEVWLDEPLQPTDWRARDGMGMRLVAVDVEGDAAKFLKVQAVALTADGMLPGVRRRLSNFQRMTPELTQSVVNRESGDVMPARWMRTGGGPLRLGTVWVEWQHCTVDAPKVVREGKWVARDKHWFKGARLAVLTATVAGEFTRTVEAKGVRIGGATEVK